MKFLSGGPYAAAMNLVGSRHLRVGQACRATSRGGLTDCPRAALFGISQKTRELFYALVQDIESFEMSSMNN